MAALCHTGALGNELDDWYADTDSAPGHGVCIQISSSVKPYPEEEH